MNAGAVLSLPRIVRFLETLDAPGSACPHCGAGGRYIHRFQAEDGRTLAAMSGCVKLFPASPIAHEELRLREKEKKYRERGYSGLNKADTEALRAIESFYAGGMDERVALAIVRSAKHANQNRWRSRNIAGRR